MSATPSTGGVPVGTQVNVSVSDIQYDCDAPYCASQAGSYCTGGGNITVIVARLTIGVLGPAWVLDLSTFATKRNPEASFVKQTYNAFTSTGVAWALVQVGGEGDIIISVDSILKYDTYNEDYPFEPNTVTITGQAVPLPSPPPSFPAVAKLLLHPTKAYRRVHDAVTLTVEALDTSGAPVANASVTFASVGDCDTTSDRAVDTTDAAGLAKVAFESGEPGAVAVVAAAVNAQGVVVLSDPSNIIFFDSHRYVEDRETNYYGGGRYQRTELAGRDADSYAKAAAKQAVQQLTTSANV